MSDETNPPPSDTAPGAPAQGPPSDTAPGAPAQGPQAYQYPYGYPPEWYAPQRRRRFGLRRGASGKTGQLAAAALIGAGLLVGAGAIGYNLHPDTRPAPSGGFRQFYGSGRGQPGNQPGGQLGGQQGQGSQQYSVPQQP